MTRTIIIGMVFYHCCYVPAVNLSKRHILSLTSLPGSCAKTVNGNRLYNVTRSERAPTQAIATGTPLVSRDKTASGFWNQTPAPAIDKTMGFHGDIMPDSPYQCISPSPCHLAIVIDPPGDCHLFVGKGIVLVTVAKRRPPSSGMRMAIFPGANNHMS